MAATSVSGALLLGACSGQVAGGGGPGPTTGSVCSSTPSPGRAPVRRLTRFEYNNTLRDLLGDTSQPGNRLPAEEFGNGFGNDADKLSVSSLLAEEYGNVAESVAARATATPEALGKLHSCGSSVTAATEETCTRSIIESVVPLAYRRPLDLGESDDLVALFRTVRPTGTFATGVAAVLEAVLQSPDFLYRLEWGARDSRQPTVWRPTGEEMATRLSYLYWATMPDQTLRDAAAAGDLSTAEGVRAVATQMLDDPRAHAVVSFFFDNLLPINGLTDLSRDAMQFPTFTPTIGSLMRQETQRFLEFTIFEGSGTWTDALLAPYTFVNQPLAAYYGMSGVTGSAFQQVPTNESQRIGFFSQGGLMAGTTHSNTTNPVVRGSFVQQKLLCNIIPLPTGDVLAKVKPPDPYSGNTGRERYSQHSMDPVCHTCHSLMDPIGLALENYDPVGLWRDTENGEIIDASGAVPGTDGTTNGPVELIQKLATTDSVKTCFASHWMEFGYGRSLEPADGCTRETVEKEFVSSGYNVKQLLLSLAQTNAFLYLPAR